VFSQENMMPRMIIDGTRTTDQPIHVVEREAGIGQRGFNRLDMQVPGVGSNASANASLSYTGDHYVNIMHR